MPPKSFLSSAQSITNNDADHLPEQFDILSISRLVSDLSPPELVDPVLLDHNSESEDGPQPSPSSNEITPIRITVSSSTHLSKKDLCLKEIRKR